MSTPGMTTVKVSKSVRDRLIGRARRHRLTADAYVSQLLDADEWTERLDAAEKAMRSTPRNEWNEYLAETLRWEETQDDIQ